VVGLVISVYFLVLVTIAQAFQKVPALKSLAPSGTELPSAVTQLVALVVFIALGVAAVRSSARLRPA
jgi:hypothetical protein